MNGMTPVNIYRGVRSSSTAGEDPLTLGLAALAHLLVHA